MQLDLKAGNHKCGAYGCVVRSSNGRAIKIFRRDSKPEEHVRNVFNSEVAAYEIAAQTPSLASITPHFYGKVCVASITKDMLNVSGNFFLDYAYVMEWIDGEFAKLNVFEESAQRDIKEKFRSAGISHMSDASVAQLSERHVVIDFAVAEFELLA